MTLLVGQYLGNYYLSEHKGRGGYADVYRCEHKDTKVEYAIKVAQSPLSQENLQLFLNEIELHSQMHHPFITTVHDTDNKNRFFLVTDYVPNGTLGRLSGQQVELSILIPYVKQIAEALDYIHQKQIIHCDVKPDNLLLSANNTIVLCDFGIAMKMTQPHQSVYGTLEYTAPERLLRGSSPASDQYSLAVSIYEWLTGDPPFDNRNDILNSPVPSLRQKLPALSQDIEGVILKALAKEPSQRYATVAAFSNALEQAYLRSLPTATPTQPPLSPAAPTIATTIFAITRKLGQPIPPSANPLIGTRRLQPKVVGGKACSIFVYQKHAQDISALAWSPDGTQIASSDIHNNVHLWGALDGSNPSYIQGVSRMILNMLWSPDATCLAIADEMQAVHFWDVKTKKKGFRYQHRVGHPDEVGIGLYYPMAWSHDGKYIISASDDQPLEKWDTTNGQRVLDYIGPAQTIKSLAWSPDESVVAFGGTDTVVRIWNATNGDIVFEYKGHHAQIRALCWSPSSKRVASTASDGIVHIWNAADGGNVRIYNEHRPRSINTIAWSPDGTKIASAGEDKKVRVWDTLTGRTLEIYEEHRESINVVTWSPNGAYLASASNDGTVRVWDAPV